MCVKILGNKLIRDNRVTILKIKNSVFKIPLTKGAAKEILSEKEGVKNAMNDGFFLNYLPEYKFFLFFCISPYLRPSDDNNFNHHIRQYFQKLFKNIAECKKVKLKNLVDEILLEFVKKYSPDDFNFVDNYLNNIVLPTASVHGDFHTENILINDNKLYFIDWSRYSKNSFRYFDLYDYYIFSKKDKNISWIEAWKKEFYDLKGEIFGIKTKREYLLAYGIWKASNDLKVLKIRGKLNAKRKKYINFINILKELSIDIK